MTSCAGPQTDVRLGLRCRHGVPVRLVSDRLPPELRPPLDVALARSVPTTPKPGALPGGCLFEPKWDGYRLLVCRDGDATALQSRQGKDLNRYSRTS